MAFKFSFFNEDVGDQEMLTDTASSEELTEEIQCEEVKLSKKLSKDVDQQTNFVQIKINDGQHIKYTQQADESHHADNGAHTDLIPGVYEGGRKTWECSFYLLDYLSENLSSEALRGKQVLEIGCGSGIPGLYCLMNGAAVTFQDYNRDVIEDVTIPNTRLTCQGKEDLLEKCRYFSGDWRHFNETMQVQTHRFDYILASETIYNTSSYEKQHNIFEACCKDGGSIYLASKYHYFGVGGGVESFQDFVVNLGVFSVKQVLTTDENLKCVILKLTRKRKT